MAKAKQKRLKRSESFFGIHFDFHAGHDCTEVGKNVTRRMVEDIIKQVRPDYIQCDCKGHPGIASYPTKVGYPAPGFVRDQLRLWREVTAAHGVALYVHYSGVMDQEALTHHPSWARVDETGKRDTERASVFGPYVDKLLIPQLKELCDEYGIDGVWVDGDCWGTARDYSKRALAAFRKETGIRGVPKKPGDRYFPAFTEFCREAYRRYLRHYVEELHRHNPDFQVCSNWAFTSFMPEPVTAEVDFISGDYPLQNSVNAARFEARCLVRQGKPWDLMAWSFASRWGEGCSSTKSVRQLQQEAAIVLALGGGFQAYFKQKRDGSIYGWTMKLMAEVARFCRVRQKFCYRAEAVPQIGLIFSTAAFYRRSAGIFGAREPLVPMRGILQALLDGQNSVEILMEHQLTGRTEEYPLLVLPEWDYLEPSFKEELLQYVQVGGSLLVIGPKAAALFRKELGVQLVGVPEKKPQWLEQEGWMGGLLTESQPVKLRSGTEPFGRLYASNDVKGPHQVAASIRRYGKGHIAATYVNLGERYVNARTHVSRDFLNAAVRKLFPEPLVEVTGSHHVDVSVSRLDGKLLVNLVNTAGPHADPGVYVWDEIPALGPLEVTIRTGTKPKRVGLQPGNRRVPYTFSNGAVRCTLPKLKLHDIVVVE
jgi:hypothetical protein